MFKTRLISGIILVAVALATIMSGGIVLLCTLLCVSLIGMHELYRAADVQKDGFSSLGIAGFLCAAAYYILIWFDFV